MAQTERSARTMRRVDPTDVFVALALVAVVLHLVLRGPMDRPAVQAWATVFLAVCIQAAPFVALGIAVSTAIAVFVPPSFFERFLPRRAAVAVPIAGLSGALLPGCECAAVPVAASLTRRGVGAAPAVAFLLSSPATNPVVLVATSVAFPGRPEMVGARFAASLATALVVGWIWSLTRWPLPVRHNPHDHGGDTPLRRAVATAGHDLAQTLGLLVVGAAAAATLNTLLPAGWLTALSSRDWLGVLAMAVFAVLLAVCSEADAFIAASLSQFSLTARLAFMVVGPAVDLKLIALQAGTFGRRFVLRYAPLAWLTAVAAAVLTGWILL